MEPVRRRREARPRRPTRASVAARDERACWSRTRYGNARRSSSASASTAPGTASPLRIRTPSRSSSRPRTPCRAARSGVVGSGRVGHDAQGTRREEPRMGLLEGRKALVFGVANDHSIAWGIAKALHDEGAVVGFSSVESLIERRVRPLADSIGSPFVEPCDVTSPTTQIRGVMTQWHAEPRRDRHPRPRDRLRQARGPRRHLRRHLARRVRARARRLRLLAGRAHPRGAAIPPSRQLASSP